MPTANSRSNQYWNGSNGQMWLDDADFEKVKEFEVKMTIEWEDIPAGLRTDRALLGFAYEGSFSYRKSDKNHRTIMDKVFKAYSEGLVPEISIIGKAMNKASGKIERIKISGVTFDELTLMNWAEKSVTEVEVPFKAYDVKEL